MTASPPSISGRRGATSPCRCRRSSTRSCRCADPARWARRGPSAPRGTEAAAARRRAEEASARKRGSGSRRKSSHGPRRTAPCSPSAPSGSRSPSSSSLFVRGFAAPACARWSTWIAGRRFAARILRTPATRRPTLGPLASLAASPASIMTRSRNGEALGPAGSCHPTGGSATLTPPARASHPSRPQPPGPLKPPPRLSDLNATRPSLAS
mmetsp:Transcript_98210/g.282462  ORF Transcript_98210/g.282462 Transcript_98210/m.282462 type:complete len:210 (+) Transcript_98210:437-1066(+)